MAAIELAEALELFKLPRKLGETPEGEPVSASIGRFGPYVRYGDKFASIRDDDPYTITLESALVIVAEKKEADANRIILDFEDEGIQVLNGRYGPYITNKEKNAKVPKDREPKSLTLEECIELLAKAPLRKKRGSKKKTKKKKVVEKKAVKKKAKRKKARKKSKKKAAKKVAMKPATKTVTNDG
jgi:DNA topoisomerase-1